ncbi:MAG: NADH-quinone oxidoreductase subunit L [Pseudomonadota bacterium]
MIEAIVFLPLLGFLFAGVVTLLTRLGYIGAHDHHDAHHETSLLAQPAELVTTALLFISAAFSWFVFYRVGFGGEEFRISLLRFIDVGDLQAEWRLRVDTLTAVMLVVVTSVSSLVHLYSIGYMSHDPHRPRFFAYLSLFTFAMLMLVTADNFVQMFFGWEGVGLASYLLIGFWFDKPTANAAAIKAFIVNRVGDFGFALGIFATFWLLGSVSFDTVFANAPGLAGKPLHFLWFEADALTVICILLFIGAMGKSAQFLLHTWLPDAMEGPTPVSALIHAATMVTAGVFMVARLSPMFEYAPNALVVVTFFGALTAFFAASVGLVQNDIKRIVAYSTCSQLGYMFVGLGVGAYATGVFHLFTHAFFKALLFLGAGSVIHAVSGEQDIRRMGGLYKFIPLTYAMMTIGTLALTGFPFTAGFFSKDGIIEAAFVSHNVLGPTAALVLVLAAFMTSFYSWRLVFVVFHGAPRFDDHVRSHIHESPKVMTVPLILLSAGALLAGLAFVHFFLGEGYEAFWREAIFTSPENHVLHDMHHVPALLKHSPTIAMALGFVLAWYFYQARPDLPPRLARSQDLLYKFLLNKWYFDELYDVLFVRSAKWLGRFLWKKGDGAVIDGLGPDGISARVLDVTRGVVRLQSGYVYHYAFAMLIGVSALITWYLFSGVAQ